MFYLSRAEQAALLLLIVLLLAGAGVLTYERGRHSADSAAAQPIFVPAPTEALALRPPSAAGTQGAPPARGTAQPVATVNTGTVPASHPAARPRPSGPSSAVSAKRPKAGLISLNTATQRELDSLPGIGPVFAQRIIAYREQRKREGHRGFESKDELLNVPGIGPKRYAAIRDRVTL
jgi:competence protein ComEA